MTFVEVKPKADFDRREVMIAMRDGVKLHTVIMVPKGAKRAPIILRKATQRVFRAGATASAIELPVVP